MASAGEGRMIFATLPYDVLERICLEPTLDYHDICHLATVSTCMRDVCCSSDIWKRLLHKRWPGLLQNNDSRGQHEWADLFISRHRCCNSVRKAVYSMSSRHYHDDEISDEAFAEFDELTRLYSETFVLDELHIIVAIGNSLTDQYYAVKVAQYVVQKHLTPQWEHFLALPPEKQSIEHGAVLLSQWCQGGREVKEQEVKVKLDDLARLVRSELARRQPRHPAIGYSPNTSEFAELTESLWSREECHKVLEALNHVLFEQLGYHGISDDFYDDKNSYIDWVLERRTGTPISLCVVYISTAQRLGVLCHPISCPQRFLVKWKGHSEFHRGQEYTYIDVYAGGKFISEVELMVNGASLDQLTETTVVKVLCKMCRYLVNVARQRQRCGEYTSGPPLRLLIILDPTNDIMKLFLARIYLHLNINLEQVPELLPDVAPEGETLSDESRENLAVAEELRENAHDQLIHKSQEPRPQIMTKRRSDNAQVKFSVGLIMKHKRFSYTCVIYGWDASCEASDSWIHQMGVNHLEDKQYQPFYNVLVDDGSIRYAAQESLEVAAEPKVIAHPKVGKYFEEFCTTHYRANEEKTQQYPDDSQVTLDLVSDR